MDLLGSAELSIAVANYGFGHRMTRKRDKM